MGRKSARKDPDRYLFQRQGNYHYKRRVPIAIAEFDERAPMIRQSLKTDDLAVARAKRDAMEAADDALWASFLLDQPEDPARARYQSAMRRVEALGYTYRTSHQIAQSSLLDDLLSRLEAVSPDRTPIDTAKALAGMVAAPAVTVSDAFEIYVDEIVSHEHVGKSAVQKAQWKKVKQRAVNNFVALCGDKDMHEITRDDAMKIYRHWLERIVPKEGRPTHSASSGNRDIGNMRVLYESYFKHIGEEERKNPFNGLSFSVKKKRTRPPFPTEWITGTVMRPGNLASLNSEARGILLAIIETGARPSEIANLPATAIRVAHPIPHIAIEPRDDPDDPREIKTTSSERLVPLIGVALEVFKRHKSGFPRYRNREGELSGTLNKFFKDNKLFPTSQHKIYSFRHAFEDRMKEAGLDEELRRILMGHAIDRPRYGSGGSLKWRMGELKRIELPFDPSII
jgi:integrase